MQKSSILIGTGVFLILFSVIYIFLQKPINSSNTSFASITPLIEQIMVVDINKTGNFTEEAVLKGQLPILAINKSENPQSYKNIQLNFLGQTGRLFAYATTSPTSIQTLDPIFSRLLLAYISPGNIVDIIPIAEAGIRSIYLDPNNRVPTELFPNGPKGYWNVANTVILADGSKREVRVIPINTNNLPSI